MCRLCPNAMRGTPDISLRHRAPPLPLNNVGWRAAWVKQYHVKDVAGNCPTFLILYLDVQTKVNRAGRRQRALASSVSLWGASREAQSQHCLGGRGGRGSGGRLKGPLRGPCCLVRAVEPSMPQVPLGPTYVHRMCFIKHSSVCLAEVWCAANPICRMPRLPGGHKKTRAIAAARRHQMP